MKSTRTYSRSQAFTMVEIMVVIAILGLILTIGLPSAFRAVSRTPIQQAVYDITEACKQARAQAILNGLPATLVIYPQEKTFKVFSSFSQNHSEETNELAQPITPDINSDISTNQLGPEVFSAKLDDEIVLEMVDVNLREFKDEEIAKVRFFPNGTSDILTIIIQWREQEWRKISVDFVTAVASVEVIK